MTTREQKEYINEYMKKYWKNPKGRTYQKKIRETPKVREYRRKYMKEYCNNPKNKLKKREYDKKRYLEKGGTR